MTQIAIFFNSYRRKPSHSYHDSPPLDELTLDGGKFLSAESTFGAKFIVQPSIGNTAADDFPVNGDCKCTVSVCCDFKDDSVRGLRC